MSSFPSRVRVDDCEAANESATQKGPEQATSRIAMTHETATAHHTTCAWPLLQDAFPVRSVLRLVRLVR